MFGRRKPPADEGDGFVHGVARVDTRTKRLIGRLQPGEIAIIDHDDIDRLAAEGLVERKVKAVVNAAPSSTGKYPNLGPLVLAAAGIPLVDAAGPELMERVKEGDLVRLDHGRVMIGEQVVAKGTVVSMEQAQSQLDTAKRDISTALEQFAENTLQYMLEEKDLLTDAIRLPEVRTDMTGRHVLVVARGYGYKNDLGALVPAYIPDFRPVLVGVDGGADALIDTGLKPQMIIGDMDSVTTQALTSGAELVLHGYPDGRAPGKERLDALGLPYVTFEAAGTSEDVALLLAHERGAELIVAVGLRAGLVELMDKGRKGMASSFLVRLRVGPKLVDAKGVSELHRRGPTRAQLFGLVFAALVTMLIVVGISEPMQLVVEAFVLRLRNVWFAIWQAFG